MEIKGPIFNEKIKNVSQILILFKNNEPSFEYLSNVSKLKEIFNRWIKSPIFTSVSGQLEIQDSISLDFFQNSNNCFHSGSYVDVDFDFRYALSVDQKYLNLDEFRVSILDNFLLSNIQNNQFNDLRNYDIALRDQNILIHIKSKTGCVIMTFLAFNFWIITNSIMNNFDKYNNQKYVHGGNFICPPLNIFLPGLSGLVERSNFIQYKNVDLNQIFNGIFQDLLPELDGRFTFSNSKIEVFRNIQNPKRNIAVFKILIISKYKKLKMKSRSKKITTWFLTHNKLSQLLVAYLQKWEREYSFIDSNLSIGNQVKLNSFLIWKKY